MQSPNNTLLMLIQQENLQGLEQSVGGEKHPYWFLAPLGVQKFAAMFMHIKKNHCIIYGSCNNFLLVHIIA